MNAKQNPVRRAWRWLAAPVSTPPRRITYLVWALAVLSGNAVNWLLTRYLHTVRVAVSYALAAFVVFLLVRIAFTWRRTRRQP